MVQLRKNFYTIRLVYLNDDFRAQKRIFSWLPWGWSPTIRDFLSKNSISASSRPIFFKLGMLVEVPKGTIVKFFQIFLTAVMTLNLTLKISDHPREQSYRADRKKYYFHIFHSILHHSGFFQIFSFGGTFSNPGKTEIIRRFGTFNGTLHRRRKNF